MQDKSNIQQKIDYNSWIQMTIELQRPINNQEFNTSMTTKTENIYLVKHELIFYPHKQD